MHGILRANSFLNSSSEFKDFTNGSPVHFKSANFLGQYRFINLRLGQYKIIQLPAATKFTNSLNLV